MSKETTNRWEVGMQHSNKGIFFGNSVGILLTGALEFKDSEGIVIALIASGEWAYVVKVND